jgi:dihydroorotase
MQNEIILPAPDDWRAHFRSGDMLKAVVKWSAQQFRRVGKTINLVEV